MSSLFDCISSSSGCILSSDTISIPSSSTYLLLVAGEVTAFMLRKSSTEKANSIETCCAVIVVIANILTKSLNECEHVERDFLLAIVNDTYQYHHIVNDIDRLLLW